MLDVKCPEQLAEAKAAAEKLGLSANLQQQLDFLDNFAGKEKTVCELTKDFAPLSFAFVIYRLVDDEKKQFWFNGGLLYHGPHDGCGSGAAPTYAVTLTPTTGWSIHT